MDQFLVMKNITKVYDNGIMANNNVNFSAKKGEIHAICGENGAGKSTLMKILSGVYTRDSGTVEIFGKAYDDLRPPSPPTTPPPVRPPVRPC